MRRRIQGSEGGGFEYFILMTAHCDSGGSICMLGTPSVRLAHQSVWALFLDEH